jgi:hypothetical protein
VSYTLRGRIESRLAALLLVLAGAIPLALAEHRWWPVEAVALMLGIGLALDTQVYDRLLRYQPGWAALPLGGLELGLLVAAMRAAGVMAPLGQAVALFGGGWLVAQVLGHAAFPLLRLGYAEEGGELGRFGVVSAVAVGVVLAGSASVAYALQPPVVHLARGVHQGPLVITRRELLVGEPGAIVRGGIVVRANGVTIRDVSVVGGMNGIVTHSSMTEIARNHVSRTKTMGISMTEMSMGMIQSNEVRGALGVGINCGDRSMCEIHKNVVIGTRSDAAGGNKTRAGFGVSVLFGSEAELHDNDLTKNAAQVGVFQNSSVRWIR